MSPSPDDFNRPLPPAYARDRGLRRSRRLTRWIAVAAITGAAALGGLYTHLLPGGSASPALTSTPVQNPAPVSPALTSRPVQNRAPASSSATTHLRDNEEHGDRGSHKDGDDEDEDEGNEDKGAARAARPALQPPVQPPAPTHKQPHTTTGAS